MHWKKFKDLTAELHWELGILLVISHRTGLPTLAARMRYLQQCCLFRIVHGYSAFPNGYVIVRTQSTEMILWSSELTVLCQPFSRTVIIHSSVSGAISYWNSLPPHRTSTHNYSYFQSLLKDSITRVHLTISIPYFAICRCLATCQRACVNQNDDWWAYCTAVLWHSYRRRHNTELTTVPACYLWM